MATAWKPLETTMSHQASQVTSSSRYQKGQACTVCQMMAFLS